ncbi:sensor histidine kinase NtrY-like [Sphingomicrobium lutaoense]|uniref:histidine kinase n=1 Tax=Sphingomicrobium lutaoense TaxID=515949 RepID=A0A839YZ89_9SPHN|nr:ATP-binding protein [Sphingomicrobium lutaoense]MBB3763780.1 two-component system nitrogen regulation sensor histidine kinase NtrY [Sphingomicrobium lutaoense]
MDAARSDSDLMSDDRPRYDRWLNIATWVAAAFLVIMLVISGDLLLHDHEDQALVDLPTVALLMIGTLIPAIVLMVLLSRKVAQRKGFKQGLGSGRLHTRLVALFSIIAAVPTVLVAIFATLLIQSGLEFWFSDRPRTLLENTQSMGQAVLEAEYFDVSDEAVAMANDLVVLGLEEGLALDSPVFEELVAYQLYVRSLFEGAVIVVDEEKQVRAYAVINEYDGMLTPERIIPAIEELGPSVEGEGDTVAVEEQGRVQVITPLPGVENAFLFVSRDVDPVLSEQMARTNSIIANYEELIQESRRNQLQFNAALLFGSIFIVGLAIAAALKLADRLARPIGQLVEAANRVEEGDFSARVPEIDTTDEVATLAAAFNRMTYRIEEQTGALLTANDQLDTRRAFIEAVLSSVTAGVIALDNNNHILLTNRSASALLGDEGLEGRELHDVSAELDEFMAGEAQEANAIIPSESGQRTLAVKRVRYEDGAVLTFDDITDQLSDQRRAAWSDIARRIAHEIKNPLTPIQLAAERLERRYGKEIGDDTFGRLTDTIVRQVGDLRRMVDEFSNFARMPKPVFRDENVHDIARAALFLHEVAHPGVNFSMEPAHGEMRMVCDRRQLSQALTNIVKNAVEAIEARRKLGQEHEEGDCVELKMRREGGELIIDVTDTGVGLPEDRERLTEPYMTTRVRGTGLGLAIVKKIVEEHEGEIAFLDRIGGGTHVRILFHADRLAGMATDSPAADMIKRGDDHEYDEES